MDIGSRNSTESSQSNQQDLAASSASEENQFQIQTPLISLPTGGGAIRSIGEKFAANPVTGTASMSVPIASSQGRSGFGPQLALSYDSGAGNGPFGLGWSLSLPSISRKTDKGLPQYQDQTESDVYLLSGAEDLVPVLNQQADRWRKVTVNRTVGSEQYTITRYRPRIEGLFALIEYWVNQNVPEDRFWRSISKDNITTWYGKTAQSRIAASENPERIFSWLICQTHDAKGNVIDYEYKSEDSSNVGLFQPHERHRSELSRTANRYIKRVKYGNETPYFPNLEPNLPINKPSENWFFELVFDYGEHDINTPTAVEENLWNIREDAFSSYRPGFEVRNYRLCKRILMFHHFDGADIQGMDGVGENYLVRSTNIAYKPPNEENLSYTQIESVSHTSWRKKADGEYTTRSAPPITFSYSQAIIGDEVQTVASDSLENLPLGVDSDRYRWVDLNGEGLAGVLTEQGGGWFYKSNESTITRTQKLNESEYLENNFTVQLGPTQSVASLPTGGLASGSRQLMDIDGNGQLDLVQFSSPMSGFFERNQTDNWENFLPFKQHPNIDWQDPNLKFIDLTGDGHADAVITEAEVITWYPSLAKQGFAESKRSHIGSNEDDGPRVLFAGAEETIFQSDFSGDGSTDIVRIRNGDICYWPNVGYGKFGKKITMSNAPWFDTDDQFSPKRIRLTDVDGTGTIDIIYLGGKQAHIYFNQSGNAWSNANTIRSYPHVDNISTVTAIDLLGNGTACLVWSSPLANDQGSQIRYIELMAKGKPHLLINTNNNMGAETQVQYVPSTYFYLKDKRAGKPWITRLPFPVHVVEQVVVTDKWRKTRFASSYSYHHGYFDGQEREFRGFGRVEQVDTESYGTFDAANTNSPYISDDKTLYQPPVKTITWYHTGAAIDREKILNQYSKEYFPNNLSADVIDSSYHENIFPQPDLTHLVLSSDEWLEAMRACKGMPLRQEVYELDVNALEKKQHIPTKLFTAAYHNCEIKRLQAKANNTHAVFFVTESEAITYNYELDLQTTNISPDPRIGHNFNVNIDDHGNVLQAVAVVYPRLTQYQDATLDSSTVSLINQVQSQLHIAYTENHLSNAVLPELSDDLDNYHLPLPSEVRSYELTGLELDSRNNNYITRKQLQDLRLNNEYQTTGIEVENLEYQRTSDPSRLQKRIVEWSRVLYFDQDLKTPLAFGRLNALAFPYETYTLALTDQLLNSILGDKLTPAIRADLQSEQRSGYLSTDELGASFVDLADSNQYWVRSGMAGFADDAAEHFYLPEAYTDAFGNITTLQYDPRDLYIQSSAAPAVATINGPIINSTRVTKFNYRVLAPQATEDINANLSETVFDTLGFPVAAAIIGKGNQGDNLDDFNDDLLDLDEVGRINFFTQEEFNAEAAATLLANASTRHIYDFGETRDSAGNVISYAQRPAGAAAIVREQHVANLPTGASSPIQIAFEYSDAGGNVLVTKSQAEPEEGEENLRWIANGKTVLNNKGKPVKQYEPYFSEREINIGGVIKKIPDHRFEEPQEKGVTPIIYYDSAGRVVRTDAPDGSYSRAEFTPWHASSYDQNDTVLGEGNVWYQRMSTGTAAEQTAASIAAKHENTPSSIFLDSLGREVIGVAFNRTPDNSQALANVSLLARPWLDEKHVTYTKLDTEGKPLWIEDARHNLVMRYTVPAFDGADPTLDFYPAYDIAGNLLFQHSMDAGDRWLINDASGQPFYAWDENERASATSTTPPTPENRIYRTQYDELRRPLKNELQINGGTWQAIERMVYGETLGHGDAQARNLLGQLHQLYDQSGVITSQQLDFKGNLLEATRQLTNAITAEVINWPDSTASATSAAISDLLEAETFTQRTQYDALNRMVQQENWHLEERDSPNYTPPTYLPKYNQRGVLKSEELIVNGVQTPAIKNITYDAKGQRQQLVLGNDTITNYSYDEQTYRLTRLTTIKGLQRFQDLHYTYDAVGNITDIRDDAQQTIYFRNSVVEPEFKYVYDALYRLIQAQGREHATYLTQRDNSPSENSTPIPSDDQLQNYTESYHYDAVGNILNFKHQGHGIGATGWNRFYQYDLDSNRLLATSKPGDDTSGVEHYAELADANLSVPYRYDTHGSMRNLERTDEQFDLHWDYRDMIHHVNLGGGGQAFYNYDSQKQRTRKRVERVNDNTIEERFHLGGMELYRRTQNGVLVEEIETYHLFATDDRVLMVENVLETNSSNLDAGVLFRYQYSNHLGSVGLELNNDADVITYEEYHPYGTTAYSGMNSDIKAVAKRYKYTGMERDEETGLSYHTARYYLPWLGRWGSSDPIGVGDGVNLYRYAKGSPAGFIDSSGKQAYQAAFRNGITEIILASGNQALIDRLLIRDDQGRLSLDGSLVSGVDAGHTVCGDRVSNLQELAVETSRTNRSDGSRERANPGMYKSSIEVDIGNGRIIPIERSTARDLEGEQVIPVGSSEGQETSGWTRNELDAQVEAARSGQDAPATEARQRFVECAGHPGNEGANQDSEEESLSDDLFDLDMDDLWLAPTVAAAGLIYWLNVAGGGGNAPPPTTPQGWTRYIQVQGERIDNVFEEVEVEVEVEDDALEEVALSEYLILGALGVAFLAAVASPFDGPFGDIATGSAVSTQALRVGITFGETATAAGSTLPALTPVLAF
ncbi:MAG: RHS repeat-associated protein [Arenicella sp.]|jgi:RHS repeat-associated protein